MFYDSLLTLKSLKERLLSSTSFSPLNGFTKQPLHKFRREGLSLTPLIAALLAACGGGGTTYVPIGNVTVGGTTPPAGTGGVQISVNDGAIEGAEVSINGVVVGRTDANGYVHIENGVGVIYAANLSVGDVLTADLTNAFDLYTNRPLAGSYTITVRESLQEDITAGLNTIVLSPITTAIDALLALSVTAPDVAFTEETALEALFGANTRITIADLHDPDNYIIPDATGRTEDAQQDAIARLSIQIQAVLEDIVMGNPTFTTAQVLTELAMRLSDGYQPTDITDATNRNDVDDREDTAEDRADGIPLARPAEENLDGAEETPTAIALTQWGFRDPGADASPLDENGEFSVRIISVTEVINPLNDAGTTAAPSFIGPDGTAIFAGAGGVITFAELADLRISTAIDFFGTLTVNYQVIDEDNNSSTTASFTITIANVNDIPTDVTLSGDRENSGADRPMSEEGGDYVLYNGYIRAADGTINGLLTGQDPEDGLVQTAASFTLGGTHGSMFEVVGDDDADPNTPDILATLRLREGVEELDGGEIYNVEVTFTDLDGGTRTETYNILQSGLYVVPGTATALTDGTDRAYSNDPDGLIVENLTTSSGNNLYEIAQITRTGATEHIEIEAREVGNLSGDGTVTELTTAGSDETASIFAVRVQELASANSSAIATFAVMEHPAVPGLVQYVLTLNFAQDITFGEIAAFLNDTSTTSDPSAQNYNAALANFQSSFAVRVVEGQTRDTAPNADNTDGVESAGDTMAIISGEANFGLTGATTLVSGPFTDGEALTTSPHVIGQLGTEGSPLGTFDYSLTRDSENVLLGDNAAFEINAGILNFVGFPPAHASGDADALEGGALPGEENGTLATRTPDAYTLHITGTATETITHVSNFTGQQNAQRDGIAGNDDVSFFHYQGGTITTADVAAVATIPAMAEVPAVQSVGAHFVLSAGTADASLIVAVDNDSSETFPTTLSIQAGSGATESLNHGNGGASVLVMRDGGSTLQQIKDFLDTNTDAAGRFDTHIAVNSAGSGNLGVMASISNPTLRGPLLETPATPGTATVVSIFGADNATTLTITANEVGINSIGNGFIIVEGAAGTTAEVVTINATSNIITVTTREGGASLEQIADALAADSATSTLVTTSITNGGNPSTQATFAQHNATPGTEPTPAIPALAVIAASEEIPGTDAISYLVVEGGVFYVDGTDVVDGAGTPARSFAYDGIMRDTNTEITGAGHVIIRENAEGGWAAEFVPTRPAGDDYYYLGEINDPTAEGTATNYTRASFEHDGLIFEAPAGALANNLMLGFQINDTGSVQEVIFTNPGSAAGYVTDTVATILIGARNAADTAGMDFSRTKIMEEINALSSSAASNVFKGDGITVRLAAGANGDGIWEVPTQTVSTDNNGDQVLTSNTAGFTAFARNFGPSFSAEFSGGAGNDAYTNSITIGNITFAAIDSRETAPIEVIVSERTFVTGNVSLLSRGNDIVSPPQTVNQTEIHYTKDSVNSVPTPDSTIQDILDSGFHANGGNFGFNEGIVAFIADPTVNTADLWTPFASDLTSMGVRAGQSTTELNSGTFTVPAYEGAGVVNQNTTGTADTDNSTPLEWTRDVTENTTYEVNLENTDDNGPRFLEGSQAASNIFGTPEMRDATAVDVNENAEGADAGIVATYRAVDNDGDGIVFSILSGDGGLFDIRTTRDGDAYIGEVFVREGQSADFETLAEYNLTIEIASTFPGATTQRVSRGLAINIVDQNDAPTDVLLNGEATDDLGLLRVPVGAIPAQGIAIGNLTSADQDAGDTHTYALSGEDAGSFAVRGTQLVYTGGSAGLKGPGETYTFVITSTDSGGASNATTETFTITQSGIYVANPPVAPATEDELTYSGGDALLAETASAGVLVGRVGDNSRSTSWEIHPDVANGSDYELRVENGVTNLYYIGAGEPGDADARDADGTLASETETIRLIGTTPVSGADIPMPPASVAEVPPVAATITIGGITFTSLDPSAAALSIGIYLGTSTPFTSNNTGTGLYALNSSSPFDQSGSTFTIAHDADATVQDILDLFDGTATNHGDYTITSANALVTVSAPESLRTTEWSSIAFSGDNNDPTTTEDVNTGAAFVGTFGVPAGVAGVEGVDGLDPSDAAREAAAVAPVAPATSASVTVGGITFTAPDSGSFGNDLSIGFNVSATHPATPTFEGQSATPFVHGAAFTLGVPPSGRTSNRATIDDVMQFINNAPDMTGGITASLADGSQLTDDFGVSTTQGTINLTGGTDATGAERATFTLNGIVFSSDEASTDSNMLDISFQVTTTGGGNVFVPTGAALVAAGIDLSVLVLNDGTDFDTIELVIDRVNAIANTTGIRAKVENDTVVTSSAFLSSTPAADGTIFTDIAGSNPVAASLTGGADATSGGGTGTPGSITIGGLVFTSVDPDAAALNIGIYLSGGSTLSVGGTGIGLYASSHRYYVADTAFTIAITNAATVQDVIDLFDEGIASGSAANYSVTAATALVTVSAAPGMGSALLRSIFTGDNQGTAIPDDNDPSTIQDDNTGQNTFVGTFDVPAGTPAPVTPPPVDTGGGNTGNPDATYVYDGYANVTKDGGTAPAPAVGVSAADNFFGYSGGMISADMNGIDVSSGLLFPNDATPIFFTGLTNEMPSVGAGQLVYVSQNEDDSWSAKIGSPAEGTDFYTIGINVTIAAAQNEGGTLTQIGTDLFADFTQHSGAGGRQQGLAIEYVTNEVDFVVNLENIDDENPEFGEATSTFGVAEDTGTITIGSTTPIAEDTTTGEPVGEEAGGAVLFTVAATDADDRSAEENGGTAIASAITYSLATPSTGNHNEFFVINGETGEVRLGTGTDFTFELGGGTYNEDGNLILNVEVVVTSTHPGSTTDRTDTQIYQVLVDDVNDAPTDVFLVRNALVPNEPQETIGGVEGFVVSELRTIDEDFDVDVSWIDAEGNAQARESDTFTYALVAGDGDTHNSRFSIGTNENGQSFLIFTGPGDQLDVGDLYSVRVQTTDSGGISREVELSFPQGSIYFEGADGNNVYSGGDGLIHENSNGEGAGVRVFIGIIRTEATNASVWSLVSGEGNNADFVLEQPTATVMTSSSSFGTSSSNSVNVSGIGSATHNVYVSRENDNSEWRLSTSVGSNNLSFSASIVIGTVSLNGSNASFTANANITSGALARAGSVLTADSNFSFNLPGTTTVTNLDPDGNELTGPALYYVGTNAGDLEMSETLEIVASYDNGNSQERYVITLLGINEIPFVEQAQDAQGNAILIPIVEDDGIAAAEGATEADIVVLTTAMFALSGIDFNAPEERLTDRIGAVPDAEVGIDDAVGTFRFSVSDEQNGVVELFSGGTWTETDQFTLQQLRDGQVRFNHDGGEQFQSETDSPWQTQAARLTQFDVVAFDPTSAGSTSSATIRFATTSRTVGGIIFTAATPDSEDLNIGVYSSTGAPQGIHTSGLAYIAETLFTIAVRPGASSIQQIFNLIETALSTNAISGITVSLDPRARSADNFSATAFAAGGGVVDGNAAADVASGTFTLPAPATPYAINDAPVGQTATLFNLGALTLADLGGDTVTIELGGAVASVAVAADPDGQEFTLPATIENGSIVWFTLPVPGGTGGVVLGVRFVEYEVEVDGVMVAQTFITVLEAKTTTSSTAAVSTTEPAGTAAALSSDDVQTGFGIRLLTVNGVDYASVPVSHHVDEGDIVGLSPATLVGYDVDNNRDEVIYTLVTVTTVGAVELNGSALAIGDTFTAQDLADGAIGYRHNGGEGIPLSGATQERDGRDTFTYTLADPAGDSGGIYTAVIDINPVNDSPTTDSDDYEHDFVSGTDVIGDFDIEARDNDAATSSRILAEGGIYVLRADDFAVYDPDTLPADVTYNTLTRTGLNNGEVVVQLLVGETWTTLATNTTTYTLDDVLNGRVRLVHDGQTPTIGLTFGFGVTDDDGAVGSGNVTINVRELNDDPTALRLGQATTAGLTANDDVNVARVGTDIGADGLIGNVFTTDEETSDQAEFDYVLSDNAEAYPDNAYFVAFGEGRELRFKSQAELDALGLQLKNEGQNYIVGITVTDPSIGNLDGQEANTVTFGLILPVRDFDVDWDIASTTTFESSPDRPTNANSRHEIDLADTATSYVIGQVRISGIVGANYELNAIATNYDDLGNVTFTESSEGLFTISLTPNKANTILESLAVGDRQDVTFYLEVRATPPSTSPLTPSQSVEPDDVYGFRRSTESFVITFIGQNENPESVDSELILTEDNSADLSDEENLANATSNGRWDFLDIDAGDTISSLYVAFGATSARPADRLMLDFAADATDVEVEVIGVFGTLTIGVDRTWTYTRNDEAAQAVPVTGATETFRIWTQDEDGAVSPTPLDVVIRILGNNDRPTLFLNDTSGTAATSEDTGIVAATVEESAGSARTTAAYTATAAQRTSGSWQVADVDGNSDLRLFVGDLEVGRVPTTQNGSITFVGRFGDLVFTTTSSDTAAGTGSLTVTGTWQYTANVRAERIANGEAPTENFEINVRDQYSGVNFDDALFGRSAVLNLQITITGDNDAPTDLATDIRNPDGTEDPNNPTGITRTVVTPAVTESGYRTADNARLEFGVERITSNVETLVDESTVDLPRQTTDTTRERIESPRNEDGADNIAGTDTRNGEAIINGVFDAIDIDAFGEDGRKSALDLHTFDLFGASASATIFTSLQTGVTVSDNGARVNPTEYDGTQGDFTASVEGKYGTLTVNRYTGEWDYVLNNHDVDTQLLGGNTIATDETFTIQITDQHGATVEQLLQINVQGTNDAPVITVADTRVPNVGTGAPIEYGTIEAGHTDPGFHDRDNVVQNATSSINFDFYVTDDEVGSGLVNLGASARGNSNAGSTTGYAILGRSLASQTLRDLNGGGTQNLTRTLTADPTQLSATNAHSNGGAAIIGVYGTLYLDNIGRARYELNNNVTATDALNEGENVVDTFEFQVQERSATGGLASNFLEISFLVTGNNDAPVVMNSSRTPAAGNSANTAPLAITITDPDAQDTPANAAITVVQTVAGAGSVTVNTGNVNRVIIASETTNDSIKQTNNNLIFGEFQFSRSSGGEVTWVYEQDGSQVRTLGHGEMETETVYLRVQDQVGAYSFGVITVTLTGVEDAAVLSAGAPTSGLVEQSSNAVGSVLDAGTATATAMLGISDVDRDDTGFGDTSGRFTLIGNHVGSSASSTANTTGNAAMIVGTYGSVSFNTNNGTVTYTLNNADADTQALIAGEMGMDAFTFQTRDDDGVNVRSNIVTITFSITGANDSPQSSGVGGTSFNYSEAVAVTAESALVRALFTDPDGDTLTYTAAGLPTGLTLSSNGTISGTLAHDSTNTARPFTVTITAEDGDGLSVDRVVTFNFANTNRAPTTTGTAQELGGTSGTAITNYTTARLFRDADGDTLSYSATGLPTGIIINATTGVISGTTAVVGGGTIIVTATDPGNLTVTRNIAYDIISGNAAPVITRSDSGITGNPAITSAEGTSFTAVNLAATDADVLDLDTAITWAITGGTGSTLFGLGRATAGATNSVVLLSGAVLDFETATSYTVIVTATSGTTSSAITLTVNLTNEDDVFPTLARTADGPDVNTVFSIAAQLDQNGDPTAVATGIRFTVTDADTAASVFNPTFRVETAPDVFANTAFLEARRISTGSYTFEVYVAASQRFPIDAGGLRRFEITAVDGGSGTAATQIFTLYGDTTPVLTVTDSMAGITTIGGVAATVTQGAEPGVNLLTGFTYAVTDADNGTTAVTPDFEFYLNDVETEGLFSFDATNGFLINADANFTTSGTLTVTVIARDEEGTASAEGTFTVEIAAPTGPTIIRDSSGNFIDDPSSTAGNYTYLDGDDTDNVLTASGAGRHFLRGGQGQDVLTASNNNLGDILAPGYGGAETVNLGTGRDIVLYRVDTQRANDVDDMAFVDGSVTINGFEVGRDKLLFLDINDNPIDNLDDFWATVDDTPTGSEPNDEFSVLLNVSGSDLTGIVLVGLVPGRSDGTTAGLSTDARITIVFETAITLTANSPLIGGNSNLELSNFSLESVIFVDNILANNLASGNFDTSFEVLPYDTSVGALGLEIL